MPELFIGILPKFPATSGLDSNACYVEENSLNYGGPMHEALETFSKFFSNTIQILLKLLEG